jgi:hypothetical protein
MKQDIFDDMAERWPSAVVARQHVESFSGGAITAKTLANMDSQGVGPQGRFRLGRGIVYPVSDLVTWLRSRSEPVG